MFSVKLVSLNTVYVGSLQGFDKCAVQLKDEHLYAAIIHVAICVQHHFRY